MPTTQERIAALQKKAAQKRVEEGRATTADRNRLNPQSATPQPEPKTVGRGEGSLGNLSRQQKQYNAIETRKSAEGTNIFSGTRTDDRMYREGRDIPSSLEVTRSTTERDLANKAGVDEDEFRGTLPRDYVQSLPGPSQAEKAARQRYVEQKQQEYNVGIREFARQLGISYDDPSEGLYNARGGVIQTGSGIGFSTDPEIRKLQETQLFQKSGTSTATQEAIRGMVERLYLQTTGGQEAKSAIGDKNAILEQQRKAAEFAATTIKTTGGRFTEVSTEKLRQAQKSGDFASLANDPELEFNIQYKEELAKLEEARDEGISEETKARIGRLRMSGASESVLARLEQQVRISTATKHYKEYEDDRAGLELELIRKRRQFMAKAREAAIKEENMTPAQRAAEEKNNIAQNMFEKAKASGIPITWTEAIRRATKMLDVDDKTDVGKIKQDLNNMFVAGEMTPGQELVTAYSSLKNYAEAVKWMETLPLFETDVAQQKMKLLSLTNPEKTAEEIRAQVMQESQTNSLLKITTGEISDIQRISSILDKATQGEREGTVLSALSSPEVPQETKDFLRTIMPMLGIEEKKETERKEKKIPGQEESEILSFIEGESDSPDGFREALFNLSESRQRNALESILSPESQASDEIKMEAEELQGLILGAEDEEDVDPFVMDIVDDIESLPVSERDEAIENMAISLRTENGAKITKSELSKARKILSQRKRERDRQPFETSGGSKFVLSPDFYNQTEADDDDISNISEEDLLDIDLTTLSDAELKIYLKRIEDL